MLVILIQLTLLDALQGHPAAVVTWTVPVPPAELRVTLAGLTVRLLSNPDWVTVYCCDPAAEACGVAHPASTVRLPARDV
jgi:hypothetical protein